MGFPLVDTHYLAKIVKLDLIATETFLNYSCLPHDQYELACIADQSIEPCTMTFEYLLESINLFMEALGDIVHQTSSVILESLEYFVFEFSVADEPIDDVLAILQPVHKIHVG